MPIAAFVPAIIAGGVGLAGAAAAVSAGKSQAKAIQGAANTAAQTQQQGLDQQIAFLNQGKADAMPYLQGTINQGRQANDLLGASAGLNPQTPGYSQQQAYADYQTGRTNSQFNQDAQNSTQRALTLMQSSNAAMGKGGAVNSGKSLKASSDIYKNYADSVTGNYNALLGGYGTAGINASNNAANIQIGQAGGLAAASAGATNAIGGYQYTSGIGAANAIGQGQQGAAGFIGAGVNALTNMPQPYIQQTPYINPTQLYPTSNVGLAGNYTPIPSLRI